MAPRKPAKRSSSRASKKAPKKPAKRRASNSKSAGEAPLDRARARREQLAADLASALEADDRSTAAGELRICELREDLATVGVLIATLTGDQDGALKFSEEAARAATQVRGARKVQAADLYAALWQAMRRQVQSVAEFDALLCEAALARQSRTP